MQALESKFFVEALGCITNRVDAAQVHSFFVNNGWVKADNYKEAQIIVVMTCGFTKASEDYNIEKLRELKKGKRNDSQIIIGGCLPSINKERLSEIFDGFVFSPRTLNKLNGFIPSQVKIEQLPSAVADVDDGSASAVRVSTGCMSNCSYCAIPFANGRTVSRSFGDILKDIEGSVAAGVRKIRLVSEDVGAYGRDKGESIVQLLRFLVDSDADFELYLDSLNPNWFHLYLPELLQLLRSPKIAKSLSIPIQSGSDRILRLMKREYTVGQVREIIDAVYGSFPDFKLSSDFIVGFPTETEEDFAATRALLAECDYHHLEIFTYEERPRIGALKLEPKVPEHVKNQRRQTLFQDYLKRFLSVNGISNLNQLRAVLDTYDKLPINFNLVLV